MTISPGKTSFLPAAFARIFSTRVCTLILLFSFLNPLRKSLLEEAVNSAGLQNLGHSLGDGQGRKFAALGHVPELNPSISQNNLHFFTLGNHPGDARHAENWNAEGNAVAVVE